MLSNILALIFVAVAVLTSLDGNAQTSANKDGAFIKNQMSAILQPITLQSEISPLQP